MTDIIFIPESFYWVLKVYFWKQFFYTKNFKILLEENSSTNNTRIMSNLRGNILQSQLLTTFTFNKIFFQVSCNFFKDLYYFLQNSMIFPDFPGVFSFFQVFQEMWEPCIIQSPPLRRGESTSTNANVSMKCCHQVQIPTPCISQRHLVKLSLPDFC